VTAPAIKACGAWRATAGRLGARAVVALILGGVLFLAAAAPSRAADPVPAVSPEPDLVRLVQTLEDPVERERLIAELRTLIAAQQQPAVARPAKPASESASAIKRMSDTIGRLAGHVVDLGKAVAALPQAVDWLGQEWSNPERRAVWYAFLWRLAAVIGGGMLASQLVAIALRGVRRRFETRPRPRALFRPPLLLGYNLIRLVPALCFVGAGYGLLALLDPSEVTRLIALTAINAHLIASLVKTVGYQGLAPWTPNLRVSGLKDETARFCARWWSRLVSLAVYGYFSCQGALLLGLPASGYAALTKLLGITVVSLLTVLVLRIRPNVSAWLRAAAERRKCALIAMLARRLADFWHALAIAYALAGGLVAAIGGLSGFIFFLKASAASFAIIWVAGLLLAGIPRLWRGGTPLGGAGARAVLARRFERYLPSVRSALQVVVALAAIVLVLEAWHVDILTWLASDLGALIVGRIAAVVAIVIIAVAVWELVSSVIDRHLVRLELETRETDRRLRARTLLPLARNALRVVVGMVATLMVLAEIGINIGPILAGVGVVGLAIGFGAQTLVKDVITGIFILLEDSLAVGDVVTVAGHSGVVEAITIRTVRLRGLNGNVYTVPFSAIDTVANLTKDFSYHVADIAVPYNTDLDRAVAVMREVVDGMRADPEFAAVLPEPIEVMGIESFEDASVVIRARIRTAPAKQWAVGRAFNRRLKFAFDEAGIGFGPTGKGVLMLPAEPGAQAETTASLSAARDRRAGSTVRGS
jgi:small conductance mechanosensitive channel